jgi:GNAT superfamily N-acetyltransferase
VTPAYDINRANWGDTRNIAALLTDAFDGDPVSQWLLPDPTERRRRHHAMFRSIVDRALLWGDVHLHFDDGYQGAALWLDIAQGEQPGNGVDVEAFRDVFGPDAYDRWVTLVRLMRQHHPAHIRHAYLPFIAVNPARQGRGIGRALLEYKLPQLDEAGVPAYLEASSARSLRLYSRVGFQPFGSLITLPEGPDMYPLWRVPQRHRRRPNERTTGYPGR